MRQKRRFRASPEWNGQKQGLEMSGFGLLLYLKMREKQGREAPTRDELVEALPVAERTVDGMLSELRKAGLLVAQVEASAQPPHLPPPHPLEEGRAGASTGARRKRTPGATKTP